MNALGIIKLGANIALGIGNQAIIGGVVKAVVGDNPNRTIRFCTKFASMALASVATAACSANVNQNIDQIAALFNTLKNAGSKESEEAAQEA